MKVTKNKKVASGSLKVDPSVLSEVKAHCKEKGILLSYFATAAIKEKLVKEK